MSLFGIGLQEILLILLVALIVLGPTRMVSSARKAGQMARQFREMTKGVPRSLEDLERLADTPLERPKTPPHSSTPPSDSAPWQPPSSEPPTAPKAGA